ncbi:MAG: 4-(cytidine 5'-diphospho)-2-C-methyl-D-erythritol kinase [Bacteroidota bacterium]
MICFPNAKINLGLFITEKRPDGFHNIESVFYPVGWNDALEVIETPNANKPFTLVLSGLPIHGAIEDNLLYKAFQLITEKRPLPKLTVYLHKTLPMGAGLGGGSSDCAFFINLLNTQFNLNLSEEERLNIARPLGSDCAFFIKNRPIFAHHKGDVFKDIALDLSAYYIAIVFPNVHSNTKEAYSLVKPKQSKVSLLDIISQPVNTWKNIMVNDFEPSIFTKYPTVENTKQQLYNAGAVYASMSGSGSAVFGLFESMPQMKELSNFPHWVGKMM